MEVTINFGKGGPPTKAIILARAAMWSIVGALGPVGWELYSDLTAYQSVPLDWTHIRGEVIAGVATGLGTFWIRHRAEVLALATVPPEVQAELTSLRAQVTQQIAVPVLPQVPLETIAAQTEKKEP